MDTNILKKPGIKFKPYHQDTTISLPVKVSELIKENILVQIVDTVVESIDMGELEAYYRGKGCPPYHPKMLIKVWIYGFCSKVYTSRPLAKKLREDLCFIWLAGEATPCFKTLSGFRGNRMQGLVDIVFKQVLYYLVAENYVDLNDLLYRWIKMGSQCQPLQGCMAQKHSPL